MFSQSVAKKLHVSGDEGKRTMEEAARNSNTEETERISFKSNEIAWSIDFKKWK